MALLVRTFGGIGDTPEFAAKQAADKMNEWTQQENAASHPFQLHGQSGDLAVGTHHRSGYLVWGYVINISYTYLQEPT